MSDFCQQTVFEQFYRQHARTLRNFLYSRCGDTARAQDLMQETFLRLWKKCSEIIGDTAAGLLFRVAGQLFLDEEKHHQVQLRFQNAALRKGEAHDVSPEYILEQTEFQTRLENAISALTEGQREVFLLNRIEKMTYAEIADRLDLSVKAIEKRMHGALVSLRETLEMKL